MTPLEYIKIEAEQMTVINWAHEKIHVARESVDRLPPTAQLRRAKAEDIRCSSIIWHEKGDNGWFWNIVSEPLHYGDEFKAYIADDGCRYGLGDAWVYKEEK